MKRLLLLLMSVSLLSACTQAQTSQDILESALAMPPVLGTNHSKGFLKYYLNQDIGLRASTRTSSLLVIDQVEVMMSVKVSTIVSQYYLDETTPATAKLQDFQTGESIDGVYLDQNNVQQSYVYNEMTFGNQVALTLDNGYVSLVALIYPAQKSIMIPMMMSILRSTQVDEASVVAHYSNKEFIEYDTIHREFFEQEVPESGSLIDMYNQMNPDDKIE